MSGAIKRKGSINIHDEKGITIIPASNNSRDFKHGDITVYNLRKMSEESIEKYGLTKYIKQLNDD